MIGVQDKFGQDQPVDTIWIDFDGVLRLWSFDVHVIEKNHGLPSGAIQTCAFAAPQLLPAIRGLIDDTAWRQLIGRELLRTYPESDAHSAIRLWSVSIGELNPGAVQTLSKYGANKKLVLATNATSRLRSDLDALGMLEYFSVIANSSELGVVKPDPAFYRAALELANSQLEHTLYIDDSVENVRCATELGLRSHHFTDVEGMELFLSQYIR